MMVDLGWRAESEMRVRSALDNAERSGGVGKGKFTTCKSESVLQKVLLIITIGRIGWVNVTQFAPSFSIQDTSAA
jgi:hypothetical protein